LDEIASGRAIETPQLSEGVTYAKKIKSREARIDWSRSAIELDLHIRGLSPFPGAWFEAPTPKGPVRVKALMSRLEPAAGPVGQPGELIGEGLQIACGEGQKPQSAELFLRGSPLAVGARLA
jgi:methionyl-tRNA formyltransferase